MIGFLLGRLLPAGAAVGMLTSALSPLRPALNAFGVAANALAGESSAGGQAMPDSLDLPGSGGLGSGFFASLFSPPQRGKDSARKQIEGLVESLKEKQEREAVLPAKKKGVAKGKKKGRRPDVATTRGVWRRVTGDERHRPHALLRLRTRVPRFCDQ